MRIDLPHCHVGTITYCVLTCSLFICSANGAYIHLKAFLLHLNHGNHRIDIRLACLQSGLGSVRTRDCAPCTLESWQESLQLCQETCRHVGQPSDCPFVHVELCRQGSHNSDTRVGYGRVRRGCSVVQSVVHQPSLPRVEVPFKLFHGLHKPYLTPRLPSADIPHLPRH